MKKRLALLLACVLVISTMLVACGSTKVEGTTWKLTEIEMDGKTYDSDSAEMKAMQALGESTFEFKKDGVFVGSMSGQTMEGTWKQDGNTVSIDFEGTTSKAKISGSKMTIEENGSKMVFEKK